MTLISFDPISPYNIIALVISMIASICIVVNAKQKQIQKSNRKDKEANEVQKDKNTLLNEIIELKIKYEKCSKEQYDSFDNELTEILLKGEQKGESLTIEIENIILYCLISMNRVKEAFAHFNSMTINFIPNQLSFVLMLEGLMNNNNKGNNQTDTISYFISRFDQFDQMNNCTFNGSNNHYSTLVQAYCFQGNYKSALIYYNKLPSGSRNCINLLLPLLYANKQYSDITNVIDQLSNIERDNHIILNYYIKALTKLKCVSSVIDTLENTFIKYHNTLNSESKDIILEYIVRKTNNEYKAVSLYSLDKTHSVNSYGIMMSLYSKKQDLDLTKYYFNELISFGHKPTMAHLQLMLKTLFQCNKASSAISFYDNMRNEWNINPDKALYELMVGQCIEYKNEFKAYQLLMQSINDNIKLDKFYYEEVLDALNASELKDKCNLIHTLYEVIKVSNFKRDKQLMQKIKIMTEKDSSISSNDTMASCYSLIK